MLELFNSSYSIGSNYSYINFKFLGINKLNMFYLNNYCDIFYFRSRSKYEERDSEEEGEAKEMEGKEKLDMSIAETNA